jgi:rhodanese-related sulfurtransferase
MNRKSLPIIVVLLAVTFQLALFIPIVRAAPHTDITVTQAYGMIYSNSNPNLLVIDVRVAADYDNGHILGAINIPVIPPPPSFNFAALEAWISGEGQNHKDDYIIVYCGTGIRSNLASNKLDAAGFMHVYDMLGAYPAWTTAGYPVFKVNAAIEVKPETFNLNSNGKWVTCYIALKTPNTVNDIDVSTINLNNVIPAELRPTEIGDYDYDTVPDLMVKFDRVSVQGLLADGEIKLVATFSLNNQKMCGGWDVIRVVD